MGAESRGLILAATLYAMLASGRATAQTAPAVDATSRQKVAELSASQLELISREDDDRALLFARDLWIRLDGGIELRADVALLWGDRDLLQLRPRKLTGTDAALHFGPAIPPAPGRTALPQPTSGDPLATLVSGVHEIYAAGHVYFRQTDALRKTDESLFAAELYQNLLEQRGIVIDAEVWSHADYGQPRGQSLDEKSQPTKLDVHIRAQALRMLGASQLVAEEAQFSTCSFGHPHWHAEAGTLTATLREPGGDEGATGLPTLQGIALADNWLAIDQTPFMPLPDFTARLDQGDSLPLKKIRAGSSTRFGTYLQTLWGADLPEVARSIEERFELKEPLALGWELDVDGYSKRGAGLGPALDWRVPGLIEGELGGYWIHDQADEDTEIPAAIEQADRGRTYLRNRLTPAEHWRLDTEVQWLSDPGFQPEFFEREFKEEKEPESYAHLVRQEDTTRWRLLYRNRLNDFQTQVDALPRGGFDMVGEPLWDLQLPDWLEYDGAPAYLVLTQAHDVANFREQQADDSLLDDQQVARADSLLDLSTTISFGPLSLRPFTSGRFTGWSRDEDEAHAIGRGVGSTGARAELLFHRNFDAWFPALSVDGLRHVVRFDADYVNVYEATRDPDELIQIDEIDELTERDVYVLAVRQRLQTHRRAFDERSSRHDDSIEDVVELDLELPLYAHAERDNVEPAAGSTAGQTTGPLHHEILFRPGLTDRVFRNAYLYSEGEWSFHDGQFQTFSAGAALQPTLDWTTIVSWRVTRDVSRVVTGEFDWRLTEKWSAAVLEQYDLDQNNGLEHRLELRRHGHDFTLAFGFERDRGDGDVAFTFALYPSFLRKGRAERSLSSGRTDRPALSGGY
ncbi:MAG: hypothetical protein EXS13_07880 [Planctomycetes bacterium]|nr:hypothetical protein [Planctomycetota bacterium]